MYFIFSRRLTGLAKRLLALERSNIWSAFDCRGMLRNTDHDGIFLGLYLDDKSRQHLIQSSFDGFFTYFAAIGFTPGSTPTQWKSIMEWVRCSQSFNYSCVIRYLYDCICSWCTVACRLVLPLTWVCSVIFMSDTVSGAKFECWTQSFTGISILWLCVC